MYAGWIRITGCAACVAVCGVYGIVWHGVCVAWHVGWRVAGRGGLIDQAVSA